ncbi:Crp/Fnr family transcriptional regulator [Novosphingobium gossypii]|uniref:Crp/Fnr family transcriptional regulator n=1 Tax=Novosphingobium gossypii TaxID=1604774 RepID=UPI003D1C7684
MHPPFHRLEEFVPLSAPELTLVAGWAASARRVERGHSIRREGDPVNGVFFLMEGWVSSSMMLRDGRRQIVKVHLPGDMLGFPSLSLVQAGESLDAITDARVCTVSNRVLGRLLAEAPRLALGLMLSTQKERVNLMRQLSWVGATSSTERLAAFLLDLHDRLSAAGMALGGGFDFPLTQQQVGELLGLTPVHINRTFRTLDGTGYIRRSRGRITIADFRGLRGLSANGTAPFAGQAAWTRLGEPAR